jgi:putative acetyltransferase
MTYDLSGLADVRPIGVDDYATVRYLHASSIRAFAAERLTIDEVDALLDYIHSPEYIDKLHSSDPMGAWIEGELAATSGWSVADDTGHSARITQLHVSPLFGRAGLGRLMLQVAEDRAMTGGFMQIGVRAIASGAAFLTHLGYEITSHGVQPLPAGVSIPVVFLRKMQSMNPMIDRLANRPSALPRLVTIN